MQQGQTRNRPALPDFSSPGNYEALNLLGASRNRAFAAGVQGAASANPPTAAIQYAIVVQSVASGFFQCWFNGTLTPAASTVTMAVATQSPTVAGTAPTLVGNTLVGTSVGPGSSCSITAVGGTPITTNTTVGGIAAAVTQASQVQILGAGDLSALFAFNLVVGAATGAPATRVALGSFLVIELLVTSTAGALTPVANSVAFGAYELS
jgi:hypothetical protein